MAKKKPKEDPRRTAPEPKVTGETYEIVRHVSTAELENIKKSGGKIVLHYKSPRVARWINIPVEQVGFKEINPDPKNNIHRVIYTVKEKGFEMLNMSDRKLAQDFWDRHYEGGEAGAPDKVLYKGNEKGARGIGVNVLKEFNKEIIGAKYQTRIGNIAKS